MATETQTKLVGFCLGNKTNYNATNYANHIWFDPTNKQILLNGIEYIPKKLSELVNDKNFLTSITKSMVEGVLTGNITSHTHSYLPLTGGTLTGALTCNGDYINMNNDSGSRGYRGFFNQSGTSNRASGSHIFMGNGQALGSNAISLGYNAFAGIRNQDADKTTYPYIAWQWMPSVKVNFTTTNQDTAMGEFYGYEVLGGKMVQYEIGGNTYTYENTSSSVRVLVCVKDDADTGLIFGGKSYMPFNATKTLIEGKYILERGESITNVNTITVGDVNYYMLAIYTWSATVGYDYSTQVKVMCAIKVNDSNYNGASSYASGASSVASGSYSVASGYSSVASGDYSVASGSYSVASGSYSVASGYSSVSSHDHCVVLARNGETMSSYQTIVGKFNAKVAGLFIIGNGTSDTARSNALVVDESGNVTAKYFSGYANAIGGEGFKIYAENNNQINFGGTASDTTIVFGAASKDSRSVPTTYKFGANGTATIQAASFSGNAATATALTSSAGSATQPIYFSNGKPVACSYTLGKSVPANAVFTDTTYSVATASVDGLMSAAMFKAQMVKSLGIKQGAEMMKPDGTITITDHRVYITQDKSNINGVYQQASGENDVKIPNATKDYDGSMSYNDKRKLDGISPYAPKKVVALRLSYTYGSVTVISGGGDYDMTQDAKLMQSASSDGVGEDYNGIHYYTTFSLDTAASSTNTLTNLFNNSFVKFSFMGKDTSYIPDTVDVKSSFDGDVLYVVFSSLDSQETWVVDCVWEFF